MAFRGEIDSGDEIARLLAALIRLQTDSQTEAISELHKSGIGPSRIAELLGTSSGTVNVAIQRSKKATSKKKATS
jgi:DNA-directed RNA polymerase specialized sigma24 family protein